MSFHSLRLSARARRDVASLLQYSFEAWGEAAQEAYGAELEEIFRSIQRFPKMGRSRDDLKLGIRVIAVNQHVVFYRIDETEIQVERVVHARMDRDSLL
jgi:toxin ParE1/3/4